ncbi:keratin, type I cytoskeletal 50 kDa-like [Pristis pectinata]|uniref:keratin, type I cytoskeletal 50 kDa-like n=1 Tax=Pristis pectinata TaxID=685728 RepID=UPI00223E7560|nr:keratin, type I cytoskeletal 50 kDa-like [Pristis pectinata]
MNYQSLGSLSRSGSLRSSARAGGGGTFSSFSSMSMSSRGRSMGMGSGIGSGFSGASFSGGSSSLRVSGGVTGNEKETMIGLNNRLSTYLEQVKNLEKTNTELELQLKEIQVGSALTTIDYSAYDQIIKPLREQILQIHLGNARLALDLDNAALAARDFQTKYENELNTRQSVEADIADLKGMKEEYIHNCKELESDLTGAQEELVYLKKDHEEQLAELRKQITGTVSVSVEAASAPDLSKMLEELRLSYETMCKKNKDEMDSWYSAQIDKQTTLTVQVNEAAESAKLQLKELRQQLQTLQAEYDSLLSANASLANSIDEINDSYAKQLGSLKMTISNLQMELTNLRNDIVKKAKEYEDLINIKMQLQMEIAKYRELLGDTSTSTIITGGQETSGVTTTVTRIETKRTF